MTFIKKLEHFFYQLQYASVILQDVEFKNIDGSVNYSLSSASFQEYFLAFNLEYPFYPDHIIIELKSLITQERISPNKALQTINIFKNRYWELDTVIHFDTFEEAFRQLFRQHPAGISEGEIKYEFNLFLDNVKELRQNIYDKLVETISNLDSPQSEPIDEPLQSNDFTLATIDDWLFDYKDLMSLEHYKVLVSSLMYYFENDSFPTLQHVIQVNGKPNKKKFGWALGRILKAKGQGVTIEFLHFASKWISLYKGMQFDQDNISKSTLYKNFTTKVK